MSTKSIEINMTDGASYNAGQVGENRAVELFIHVPQDMYNIAHHYRLVFSNGVVTPLLQIIPPENDGEDGVIRYFIESELTSSSSLGMQLEEYGEDGLIDKSSIVNLKFGNSLSKPKEVFFNKDIIGEINQNTISRHTHSNYELLESITADDLGGGNAKDDVVLLPFGEPINLVIREVLEYAHFYLYANELGSWVYSAELISTDGRHLQLTCGNGECFAKYTNGANVFKYVDSWERISGTEETPNLNGFTIERFSDENLEADNMDYLRQIDTLFDKFKVFCQCFRADTTADDLFSNFNGLYTVENRVEALGRWVNCDNRAYVANVDAVSFNVSVGARHDGTFIINGYSVLYIDLAQDCDVAINGINYYVGGEVPNTKTGKHKWIFNETPTGEISLGALDLEAIV